MSASQDARQVLLEISLLAGGATQNLNASRGGGDAIGPGGDGRHMLIYWRKAFASACWGELPELVDRARAELDGFKKRTAPLDASQDPEKERREQMLENGAGQDVGDVATAYGYSASLVRKYRRNAHLHPETGLSTKTVEQLKAEKKGPREIARMTGIPLTTVHRKLGKVPAQSGFPPVDSV